MKICGSLFLWACSGVPEQEQTRQRGISLGNRANSKSRKEAREVKSNKNAPRTSIRRAFILHLSEFILGFRFPLPRS
jgi:hypothetical protein